MTFTTLVLACCVAILLPTVALYVLPIVALALFLFIVGVLMIPFVIGGWIAHGIERLHRSIILRRMR